MCGEKEIDVEMAYLDVGDGSLGDSVRRTATRGQLFGSIRGRVLEMENQNARDAIPNVLQ
jgi:hypothetical protein